MPYFRLTSPLTRSLALASLAGAALLAGSLAPAAAQTPETQKQPPAAAAATSTKPETVEQRIITLKYQLYQGNWWFQVQGIWLGYYPATLFQGTAAAFTNSLKGLGVLLVVAVLAVAVATFAARSSVAR